jgi:photosystem II stability/assembly factor-like uncharacterized protein
MKKPVLLLIFAIGLFTFTLAQQYGWTDISANLPAQGSFNDVQFIGDEGWITGGNDQVFYTSDGGETFVVQDFPPLPGNEGITSSIFMKNNEEGYVVTYSGEINKTDNSGANWSLLHDPGGVFNSVHCPPGSDTCYACGGNGTVYSFTNTGITDISPSGVSTNLQSICFPENNSDGKVCGQTTIARYKNSTWNNLQFYDCTLNYNSIFFINNNEGWACGINGTIILTIDGTSWIIQSTNVTEPLNDIFFLNSQEGWAVGTEVLLHTTDGGTTWTREAISLTAGKELRAIYFTSANNGYVVGSYTVLKFGEVSGIEDYNETFGFEIFPNPCRDGIIQIAVCNIQYTSYCLEVLDLSGRAVVNTIEGWAEEHLIRLDISPLPPGIYFIRIYIENKMIVKKIIKV